MRIAQKRWSSGAGLWALSALILPLQLVVALRWPDGYSLAENAISDLGVTSCRRFTEGIAQARFVCSPWHDLFNFGVVLCGALTALGAILLLGRWGTFMGRVGTVLAAVSGVFVAVVGLAPWDLYPQVHDAAALAQAVLQWLAMLLLAAAGRGRFRIVTCALVALSVASFCNFVLSLEGEESVILPFGVAERLAFDTLTLWTAAVGVRILAASRSAARSRTRQWHTFDLPKHSESET